MSWSIASARKSSFAYKSANKRDRANVGSGVFPSRMTNFGIQKYLDTLLERQPTGRVGKPSDFAGVILFLSSVGSAHMTGNVIELDGGSTLTGWRAKSKGGSKI